MDRKVGRLMFNHLRRDNAVQGGREAYINELRTLADENFDPRNPHALILKEEPIYCSLPEWRCGECKYRVFCLAHWEVWGPQREQQKETGHG